jgi:hypothetical protein
MTENTLIVLEDKSVANIQFNFEELKAWALAKVEKYQNLTITEEQVIDIKKEMADINKYSKEIDAKRKEFEKQYKARIDPVLAQILEIKGIFDSAYNGLKTQVDNFETIEREKRRIAIKEQIEEIIQVEGLQQYAKRFEIQEKWLNKTTSQKSIKADLDNIVAEIKSWIETQEKAMKMREERIQMVSEFYKAKVESYGFDLGKESYFIAKCDQCEGTAITVMINSAFEAELKYREARKRQEEDAIKEAQKQAEAEAKAKEKAEAPATIQNPAPLVKKEEPKAEVAPEPKQEKILAGSVRFTFKESNFEKIKGLMGQIKQLCETWENE